MLCLQLPSFPKVQYPYYINHNLGGGDKLTGRLNDISAQVSDVKRRQRRDEPVPPSADTICATDNPARAADTKSVIVLKGPKSAVS